MQEPGTETRFIESFHYLPDPRWAGALLNVRRAGVVAAGADYGIERSALRGHDLLYCVAGAGVVWLGDSRHEVSTGQLAWLHGNLPHAHAADRDDPWTVMWLRLDGPAAEVCQQKLMGDTAVLTIMRGAALVGWFQRLFACLRTRSVDSDLALNGLAADLLILLDAERRGYRHLEMPATLTRLTRAMSAQPQLPWNEADMLGVARISAAHLRRLFRQYMQMTPRAWLRRERTLMAQEMLLTPGSRIAAVAEACGFSDIYHFSREFKRSTGQAPSEWRAAELGKPSANSPRGAAKPPEPDTHAPGSDAPRHT